MIIMKVKLCSVGYTDFTPLAKKFAILYRLCEEQLSQQKHYDFGLRNILSVLRTCGANKRKSLDKDGNPTCTEEFLMYRTLRDMNLSKFVAQDVPLFLSLLADLFPRTKAPPGSEYRDVEKAISGAIKDKSLVEHESWVKKVVQLYETYLVRHGIMLVGPTGGGKTRILEILSTALSHVEDMPFKFSKLNPKAIRAAEMYGEVDPLSGEWTTGCFAAMWARMNQRSNKFSTWLICDGPVDAIWIEDLNTVLDDNKILTLANGDRIPMTDQNKIMFEVESLANASPATVSRAGIIYVSDTELDWEAVVQGWLAQRQRDNKDEADFIKTLYEKWFGHCDPTDPGALFLNLSRGQFGSEVIESSRVGKIEGHLNLLTSMLKHSNLADTTVEMEQEIERLFVMCIAWSIGGNLTPEGRQQFDEYLRSVDKDAMPEMEKDGDTIYEYTVDFQTVTWVGWSPELWMYPETEILDFSNLLVPTMDSTRAAFVLDRMHEQRKSVMMVGGPGTAKTSSALMYFSSFDSSKRLLKQINFSSATTMFGLQSAIEGELDKRGGKNFGPPNGKKMTVFLDDISMPLINEWGDQPTLEFARQLVETNSFCFLDKDKRGDLKQCEDLQYVAAMGHPGGGKNDIPSRLKRHFLIFNMVLPSITSINDIYGQMMRGRFTSERGFASDFIELSTTLTTATIEIWQWAQRKFLPTPKKFHYVFNMREVSRVFQGVLFCQYETIIKGGQNTPNSNTRVNLIKLWKHECERVFCDKLVDSNDKNKFLTQSMAVLRSQFGAEIADELELVDDHENSQQLKEGKKISADAFVSFLRDDIMNEDGTEVVVKAPKIYEPGGTLGIIRDRVSMFMLRQNAEFPATALKLVLFDDALSHLLRISRILTLPRGSALLVGVGGSGKQSLTRFASYIAGNYAFQIALTKTYSAKDLLEDLRGLFIKAGSERKPVTFLFTDQEIKSESFLEMINTLLMTGEIPGMFTKEELLGLTADLEQFAVKERPGFVPNPTSLRQYFYDTCRDNLHVVLCMSPVNPKFPERARKFPGLINCCTIDWFLRWPEQALKDVARGFIESYNPGVSGMYLVNEKNESAPEIRQNLMNYMGTVHEIVVDTCSEYEKKMRRMVYQTPKSYLAFIEAFQKDYGAQLEDLNEKSEKMTLGLEKLEAGAEDVEAMKLVLKDEDVKLQKATKETNEMIASLEVSSMEAKKESEKVEKIQTQCAADAERIGAEKDACNADLEKAMPYVRSAETAIDSIKPAHIQEVKKLGKPSDIIRLVFDGVLILFMKPLNAVKMATLVVKKQEINFVSPSYDNAQKLMGDANFLKYLLEFGSKGKDLINDETTEFLMPYIALENFTPSVAKSASAAAEGLCTWVEAMKYYQEASKIVKPKLEALAVAMGELDAANAALSSAAEKLSACQATLDQLQSTFDAKLREKAKIEEGAKALQRKMDQASSLINGLSGERERWTIDRNRFGDLKRQLVGDCAIASAFVSYCGPFNQEFRTNLTEYRFIKAARECGVPVSNIVKVDTFLTDVATIGEWNIEGLPADPLSVQNGILVTQSSRYPNV